MVAVRDADGRVELCVEPRPRMYPSVVVHLAGTRVRPLEIDVQIESGRLLVAEPVMGASVAMLTLLL